MNRNIFFYRVIILFKSFIISHENCYTNGLLVDLSCFEDCIPFSFMMYKCLNVTTIFIVRVLVVLCSEHYIMIWYKLENVAFDLIDSPSQKFHKIHNKTPVSVLFFNKVADLESETLLEEFSTQVFSC